MTALITTQAAALQVKHAPAFIRCGADDYHNDEERISRSQIGTFIESRKTFYRRHVLREPYWQQDETAAMKLGTLFHRLVLEAGEWHKLIAIIPRDVLNSEGSKVGKAWIQWKNAPENANRIQMKSHEVVELREMWDAIQHNATARELLFGGDAAENELTLHWQDAPSKLLMRARLDRVRPWHAIVDLKTIDEATPWAIERAIDQRLYYLQGAMYQDAFAAVTGHAGDRQELPFILVFVGKSKPFDVVSVQLSQAWIDRGREIATRATCELAHCLTYDKWETPTGKGIIVMEPPTYNFNRWGLMPWRPMESQMFQTL